MLTPLIFLNSSFGVVLIFCLLTLLITISNQATLTFCQKDPACIHLNDQIFLNAWSSIQKQLDETQQIYVRQLVLNQNNMIKLFSHAMPKIKAIDFFSHQINPRSQFQSSKVLSPKIIQAIFQSEYFQRLQILDLQRANLDYRHFKFLQKWNQNKKISLKNFTLSQNFLQKRGFKYLQRLNFNGSLISFGIALTSLVQEATIDSIIKIITPKNDQMSSLVNITLYQTSITGENLIKILKHISPQKLQSLNIGANALQHSKKFTIPFNNSIYQYLTSQNYTSLRRLIINGLDLDETHLQYFQNWKLPALEILGLSQNFINDEYFLKWITKQNMPKLKQIDINVNNITDNGVKLLVQQNFQLQTLTLVRNKELTGEHVGFLSKMNTKNLKHLTLSSQFATQNNWKQFFRTVKLQQLELLSLVNIKKMKFFFSYLDWKNMKKLKQLLIENVDMSQSFELIFSQNISFPNLETLLITGSWFSSQNKTKLINNLHIFSPKLKKAQFSNNMCLNFSQINIQTLPDNLYIQVQCMVVRKIQNQSKFEAITMIFDSTFIMANQNRIQCENLTQFETSQNICNYNFDKNLTIVKIFADKISKFLQFKNIESIMLASHQGTLLFKQLYFGYISTPEIQNEFQMFQDSLDDVKIKTQVHLLYIKYISFWSGSLLLNSYPSLAFYIAKINAPQLKQLQIYDQKLEDKPKIINVILSNSKNIQVLKFVNGQLSCESFPKIFNKTTFPYLTTFQMTINFLQAKCLQPFIKNHQAIREIQLSGNFLQKNISNILCSNDLLLKTLGCQMIRIGNKQFAKMSCLNTQFLVYIDFGSIGINSQGMKSFVENKHKKSGVFFPKMKVIMLNSNNIESDALNALLQTGMPNLIVISLVSADNPNFINDILSYPNKFQLLLAYNMYIYSVNSNLDPRSTRHVGNILIQSDYFTQADYKNLAKLSLDRLQIMSLILKEVSDCEVLKDILKMSKKALQVQFIIDNQKALLNDTCISDQQVDDLRVKYMRQPIINWGSEPIYVPKFINALFPRDQQLLAFHIEMSYIGDETFMQILSISNFDNIQSINIKQNHLTQISVAQLFKKNLSKLVSLQLTDNQFTYEALLPLVDKKMEMLSQVSFSGTCIGDKGIQVLTRIQFPNLNRLYIASIDLTLEGLLKVFQINAPKLQFLGILNNNVNQEEFMEFIESLVYIKFQYFMQIQTNIRISSRNMQKIKIILQTNKKMLQIKAEVYHIQQLTNAAKIQ